MREIEFRGKSISSKQWVYGNLILKGNKAYIVNEPELISDYGPETDFYLTDWHEVYQSSIGQYTGSKDTKGRKIYEGDILSDGKERYIVKYSFTETGMIAKGLGKEGTWSLYHLATNHNKGRKIEAISNMHDNPELVTA